MSTLSPLPKARCDARASCAAASLACLRPVVAPVCAGVTGGFADAARAARGGTGASSLWRGVPPQGQPPQPASRPSHRTHSKACPFSFLRSRCGGEVEMRVMGSLATGRRCHLLCSCTRVHADFGVTPGASTPTPLPARRLRASASGPLISSPCICCHTHIKRAWRSATWCVVTHRRFSILLAGTQ